MDTSSSFILRVVQFWMAGALLLAIAVSAVIAFPFLLIGKLVDYMEFRRGFHKPASFNI